MRKKMMRNFKLIVNKKALKDVAYKVTVYFAL